MADGVDDVAGFAESFGQCEEELISFEMSQIGSPLGLALRSYTGMEEYSSLESLLPMKLLSSQPMLLH